MAPSSFELKLTLKSASFGTPSAIEQHVGRLHVAVQHTLPMRMVEGRGEPRAEPADRRWPIEVRQSTAHVGILAESIGHVLTSASSIASSIVLPLRTGRRQPGNSAARLATCRPTHAAYTSAAAAAPSECAGRKRARCAGWSNWASVCDSLPWSRETFKATSRRIERCRARNTEANAPSPSRTSTSKSSICWPTSSGGRRAPTAIVVVAEQVCFKSNIRISVFVLARKSLEIIGRLGRVGQMPADQIFLVDQIARQHSAVGQLRKLGQIFLDRLGKRMLLPAIFQVDLDQLAQDDPPHTRRVFRQEFAEHRRPRARLPGADQRIDPRGQLIPCLGAVVREHDVGGCGGIRIGHWNGWKCFSLAQAFTPGKQCDQWLSFSPVYGPSRPALATPFVASVRFTLIAFQFHDIRLPAFLEGGHVGFAENFLQGFITARVVGGVGAEIAVVFFEQALLLKIIAKIPGLAVVGAGVFAVKLLGRRAAELLERWTRPWP